LYIPSERDATVRQLSSGVIKTMRLLMFEELQERGIPYSRNHVRRLERSGEFPQHVQITENGRRIGWPEVEIDRYVAKRIARRDAETVAAPTPAPRRRRQP
jgi:predicted DNA-binding transcriptional regulator AlpA